MCAGDEDSTLGSKFAKHAQYRFEANGGDSQLLQCGPAETRWAKFKESVTRDNVAVVGATYHLIFDLFTRVDPDNGRATRSKAEEAFNELMTQLDKAPEESECRGRRGSSVAAPRPSAQWAVLGVGSLFLLQQ